MAEQKPSWQTKEFWLSVAAFVVSLALVITGEFVTDDPNSAAALVAKGLGMAGALLSSLGYGGIRTAQKANELKAEAAKALANPPSPSAKP